MSMWSRVKVAVLTASVAGATLYSSGCLGLGSLRGLLNWKTIEQYVAIGSIFS
jgi:hypothetical protein